MQHLKTTGDVRRYASGALALMLGLAGGTLGAGTPAGTLIRNEAVLEFTPSDGAPPTLVPSNTTETPVAAICRASVLPNGTLSAPAQTLTLNPGESGVFPYTLTNGGNATNTFNLRAEVAGNSAFTPAFEVYRDLNANGRLDTGEVAVSSLTLDADAQAALLVRATSGTAARGTAFLNLVADCATNVFGDAGESDSNNVSRLDLREPPALSLNKTFTPSTVRPGEVTTVTLTMNNAGGGAAETFLTDLLNTPELRDFVFVSGSARLEGTLANAATLEYTADGTTWTTAAPATVAGIRARLSSVPSGGSLSLVFGLRAPVADQSTRRNVATLVTGTVTTEATADITVVPRPEIALGPIGNPQALPGGELSADDLQVRASGVAGTEVCFSHTVQNLGDLPDTITTSVSLRQGEARVTLRRPDGTALDTPFTVTLASGATADFQVCFVPASGSAPLDALLTSTSSRGAAPNSTVDRVTTVISGTTPITKTSDRGEGVLVAPGGEITYTLTFTNNLNVPLTDVELRDNLRVIKPVTYRPSSAGSGLGAQSAETRAGSVTTQRGAATTTTAPSALRAQAPGDALLEFVRASDGGVLEGEDVVWRVGVVQPGETVTRTVTVRVPAGTADGTTVVNTFTVTSGELPPVTSPPTSNPVYIPDNLQFSKDSSPKVITPGGTITYVFTLKNNSTVTTLRNVVVNDTLPTGLVYQEGSSDYRVFFNTPPQDFTPLTPTVDGRTYTWTVPELRPGQTAEVRFRGTVTAEANGQLRNTALAGVVGSERETTQIPGTTQSTVEPLSFGINNADLVGYVFTDRNRNGIYDYKVDVPQVGARVILANGRIARTDTDGRYHFRDVREGSWALRLDPNTVASEALSIPQDAGRNGSRLIYVRNLTSADFPLAPDGGDIAVVRETTLRVTGGVPGDTRSLSVFKQVFKASDARTDLEAGPTEYVVQLTLTSSDALPGFSLTDPLPDGATLVSGENTVQFDPLPGGERVVTYRFRWSGDIKGAVTDPTANWRYAE